MKYFLHDTSSFSDDKITELYIEFGYEGLGLFYTVLERLALQEKPIKTSVLKAQLKVGKRLQKCWKFLEHLGLLSSTNGETFNEKLLNYSESYKIKKENNSKRILQWREKQQVTENVTHSEQVCNMPKGIRSKGIRSNKSNTNSIELRKKEFSASLTPFLEKYGKDTLNDFYTYWTEPNKSSSLFRKEMERTWSTAGRLKTWAKNDFKSIKAKTKGSPAVDQSNNQNLFR